MGISLFKKIVHVYKDKMINVHLLSMEGKEK